MRSENSPKHTHIMTSQNPLFMRFRFFGFFTASSRLFLVVRSLFDAFFICVTFVTFSGVHRELNAFFYCAANSAFLTASSPLRCIFVGSYTRTCMRAQNSLFMGVAFVAISPSSLRVQHGFLSVGYRLDAYGNTQAQRSTHEAAFFNCWACVSAALKYVGC